MQIQYYCNYCDHTFDLDRKNMKIIHCSRCGVIVTSMHDHTAPHVSCRVLDDFKSREIIRLIGWRKFKQAFPGHAELHPELRPKKS